MKHLPTFLSIVILFAVPLTAHANKTLAEKRGCLGCHAVATKLVGPAFEAVSAKYADQPNAKEMLAQSIHLGGVGKWGDMPMPAQTQLSPVDANKLAVWILGGAK